MNNIKNFDQFVNELKSSTYDSAAKKMMQHQDYKRSDKLIHNAYREFIGKPFCGSEIKEITIYNQNKYLIKLNESVLPVKDSTDKLSWFTYDIYEDTTTVYQVETRKDFRLLLELFKKINPDTKFNQNDVRIKEYKY